MELKILDIILGFLSILSFTWSYFSPPNRIIAIVLGFLLVIVLLISEKNSKLHKLEDEQKKLGENLKYTSN